MDVKVRLHRTTMKDSNGKVVVQLLHETGRTDDRFIINGSLKFEANKAGSFEFDILPSHPRYADLRRYVHYVSVTINEDDEELVGDDELIIDEEGSQSFRSVVFYGRILSISMAFNRVKHVTCEGLLANLVDAPMYNDISNVVGTLAEYESDGVTRRTITKKEFDKKGKWTGSYIATLVSENDESKQLYKVDGSAGEMWIKAGDAYRNLMQREDISFAESEFTIGEDRDDIDVYSGQSVGDFVTGELIDVYGGFLQMNYNMNEDDAVFGTLHWLKDPGMDGFEGVENEQSIEYGVNLLDLSAEFLEDSIVNGVIVAWTALEKKTDDDGNEIEEEIKKWNTLNSDNPDADVNIISIDHKNIEIPKVYGSRNATIQVLEVPGISGKDSAASYARAYVKKFCKYKFAEEDFDSYTVKAVDRHFIDPDIQEIKLYDQVRLKSEPHGIDRVLTCTSIEFTIDNPIARSYKLDVFKPKPSSNEKVLSKQIGKKIKYRDKTSSK